MKSISRRTALSAFGAVGGATLLTGCGDVGLLTSVAEGTSPAKQKTRPSATDPTTLAPSLPTAKHNWRYVELDAAEVADRAYRIYPDGGCMYAVVGSVMTALSDKVGEPFRSFPINMMRCLAADGAAKLVGILNRASINESDFVELSAEVGACIDCHGPKDKGDAMGKMNCSTCHQFDGKHP